MNTNDRVDAQIVVTRELENGLLETWNAAELAGDVLMALEQGGWEITRRRDEQCGHLKEHDGLVFRCNRHEAHGGDHAYVGTPFQAFMS